VSSRATNLFFLGEYRTDQVSDDVRLIMEVLRKGGRSTCRVDGNSMRPLIRLGDRVEVVACKFSELRLGDVVMVASPNGLLIHRLLLVVPGSGLLVTKGDALARLDPLISPDLLLGRVCSVQRESSPEKSRSYDPNLFRYRCLGLGFSAITSLRRVLRAIRRKHPLAKSSTNSVKPTQQMRPD